MPPGNQLVDGWTVFPPQTGSRVIYVSNAGNDAALGTELQPKATLAAGYAELRDGQADELRLRRGDTWTLASEFQWTKSGPSANSAGWMRLGAYGDPSMPRPILDGGAGRGMVLTPGYRSSKSLTHVAVTDVHFLASGRLSDPSNAQAGLVALSFIAVEWQGTGSPFAHVVIENVKFEGYGFGVSTGRDVADLAVRRSVFTRIFSPGGEGTHGSGILTTAQGFLLEENVFYLVQHPDLPSVTGVSHYAHSAYIAAQAADVVTRGNYVIKTTEGLMQRPGGTYEDNVSAYNDLATNVGMSWGVEPTAGGVLANVRHNLFLNPTGDFVLGNARGGTVENNLLVIGPGGTGTPGIALQGYSEQTPGGFNIGVHDVTFRNNRLAGNFTYAAAQTNPQHFSGLVFDGNTVNAGSSTVTVQSFLSSIGRSGTTIDDWGRELAARDRGTFRADQLTPVMIDFYDDAVR